MEKKIVCVCDALVTVVFYAKKVSYLELTLNRKYLSEHLSLRVIINIGGSLISMSSFLFQNFHCTKNIYLFGRGRWISSSHKNCLFLATS